MPRERPGVGRSFYLSVKESAAQGALGDAHCFRRDMRGRSPEASVLSRFGMSFIHVPNRPVIAVDRHEILICDMVLEPTRKV